MNDKNQFKTKTKTYTTSELASVFGVSVGSISALIKKWNLKPVKTGNNNSKYYDMAVFDRLERHYDKSKQKRDKTTNTQDLRTQLAVSKQMLAVHIPGEYEDDDPELSGVFFNPRIISHSVENACLRGGEGCLSVDREVPGYVPRHARITLRYMDSDGETHKKRFSGYPAIVLQHEIDHLHGILFFDHINEKDIFALDDNTTLL